jgi:predicted secreted Zn-dependent protease
MASKGKTDKAIKDANSKGASRHPSNDAGEKAGETTWKYNFSARYGYSAPTKVKGDGFASEAKTTDVTVTVTINVDLPTWDGYSSASPEEQQNWDKYSADLKDHKDGHVEIAEKGATAVGNAIQGTTATGTGKTPAQAVGDAKTKVSQAQQKNSENADAKVKQQSVDYDEKTKHGNIPRKEIQEE